MSHFTFENDINNVLRMDAPITTGPQMRWQRKMNESTFNSSKNESAIMNNSVNTNCLQRSKAGTPVKHLSSTPGLPLGLRTPGKTPFKTPKKTPGKQTPSTSGDRFIPSRGTSQFDLGHHLITQKSNATEENDAELLSPSKREYKEAMSENLNGGQKNKILTYNHNPPQAPKGYNNNLKVLYSSSKNPIGSTKKVTRTIPQVPDRILDAPEILDDYYLNLLDWSRNNHLAVCLGGHVYLWDAGSGEIQQLMEVDSQDEYVSSVAWVNEGTYLGVGTSTGDVQLWDVEQQKRLRNMTGHAARVGALSWNSHLLSSGSRSGQIHHHDVRVQNHHIGTLSSHTQEVCGLRWSPDGRHLASGGNDNMLHVWDALEGQSHTGAQPLHTFTQHQAAVKALAWCPWQPSLLASGGGTADRQICFWNCNTGSCVQSIDTKSQVCALLWSTEYKELVSSHGYAQNQITLWKYPSLSKVAELTGHTSRVLHMAMSPDGQTIVSAAADETLRLWKCFAVDPQKKKQTFQSSAKKDLNSMINSQRLR